MCGITGIYGIERLNNAERIVKRMNDRLAHRGPNAEGVYQGKNVVMGHRRLSIIDLSDAANQPWRSPDGRYALVFNGELYNYKSLRAELDFPFTTQSDTEVVLAALMQWGMAALQRFHGMFALAFWDDYEEKLYLVRDRLGIKPLYYCRGGNSVVFASEVRAILASGLVQPLLNQRALDDYLRYQTVHAPQTLIQDVHFLEAGTYLALSDAEQTMHEYWKPWLHYHADLDPLKVQKQVRDKLTEAVSDRLVADVPFGAFLSGGIDSSLIVGIIRERLNLPLDTFHVSFDESAFSEAHHAALIAKKFGTNHHEIKLTPGDFLMSLPEALQAVDHPSGDGPNTWIVSRETKRQGISMALSGLGGDELFAGYDVFRRIPNIAEKHWILSFPKGLRALAGNALMQFKPGMQSAKTKEVLLTDYFDLKHLYPIMRKVLLDREVQTLRSGSLQSNRVVEWIEELERYPDFGSLPTLSRIGIAEMQTYMQHVLLRDTDQMSMAHALEVRVPFLDHRLVEYVTHVVDPIKYPHSPKRLLVESFQDLLPTSVVDRTKMGFVLPWEHWLKDELNDFAQERINLLAQSGHLNGAAVEGIWRRFLKNDPMVGWSRVWPLISLADWMEKQSID
jgi:asparagine synthase (glutamine-hydrolysing)